MAAFVAKDTKSSSKENSNNLSSSFQNSDLEDVSKYSQPINKAQQNIQLMADKKSALSPVGQLNAIADEYSDSKNGAQEQASASKNALQSQSPANKTGLPDNLKSGVESLSGHSMDDVKVHYNSGKPATLNAHAYAQGNEIHLGAGQEKHLPHEAWHVAQQKQGRVKPTAQLKGKTQVNDDPALEKEADVMGTKAMSTGQTDVSQLKTSTSHKKKV